MPLFFFECPFVTDGFALRLLTVPSLRSWRTEPLSPKDSILLTDLIGRIFPFL